MAMLAAPRRKQKVINLRAKNSEWSNDTNKFGQKMLEKMGWTSGKGLGAKENGIVEHVVARYKNDDNGLGYEDQNDQWTKHEDDFNALLANLSNGGNSEEHLHSGVSLEDKSKKSKARVHYHKFTRGKDLSRYSEKQLANIFGKKSLKKTKPVKENDKEDLKTTQVVFTEKGSMEDYFKNKLAAKMSKNTLEAPQIDTTQGNGADFAFKGFSGTTKDEPKQQGFGIQSFSFYNSDKNDVKNSESAQVTEDIDNSNKKRKKSKKQKKLIEENENITDINNESVEETQPEKNSKKSKKHKHECEPEVVEEIAPESKKSKKKRKNISSTPEVLVPEPVELDESIAHIPKKKKKRKIVDVCENFDN